MLQIQKAQKVIQKVAAQVDTMFTNMINQQLQNKTLSAEDQQRIEAGSRPLGERQGYGRPRLTVFAGLGSLRARCSASSRASAAGTLMSGSTPVPLPRTCDGT